MKTYRIICIMPDGVIGYKKPAKQGRPDDVELTSNPKEAERFSLFVAADIEGFGLRERRKVRLYSVARFQDGIPVSISI